MSYPREAISLPLADHLVYELNQLIMVKGFNTWLPNVKVMAVLVELRLVGVSAKTTVKVFSGSTGETSVLSYAAINIRGRDEDVDSVLMDWIAAYAVTGVDKVDFLISEVQLQGC